MTTRKLKKGLSLLGHVAKFPEQPVPETLETFPNNQAKRNYWIVFDCQEFTSMCPVTGQPDFARILIEYIPNKLCIETKSLKYYLASFRSTRAFNETIINQILNDLVAISKPRRVVVIGQFAPRGGIGLKVIAEYPDNSNASCRHVPSILEATIKHS